MNLKTGNIREIYLIKIDLVMEKQSTLLRKIKGLIHLFVLQIKLKMTKDQIE